MIINKIKNNIILLFIINFIILKIYLNFFKNNLNGYRTRKIFWFRTQINLRLWWGWWFIKIMLKYFNKALILINLMKESKINNLKILFIIKNNRNKTISLNKNHWFRKKKKVKLLFKKISHKEISW